MLSTQSQPLWRSSRDQMWTLAVLVGRGIALGISMICAAAVGVVNAVLALAGVAFWFAIGVALCLVLLRNSGRIWPFH
jgi:Flp pilus assembly protein TadB